MKKRYGTDTVLVVRCKKTEVDWIVEQEEVEVLHMPFGEALKYAAVKYYVTNVVDDDPYVKKIYVR